MKYNRLALAIGLVLSSPTGLLAETIEERLARMEAKMAEMQRNMDTQNATIKQQATTINEQNTRLEGSPARLRALAESMEETQAAAAQDVSQAWYNKIELGGLLEVEAFYASPYEGPNESDIVLSTFELGIASQVTDWVEVGASLLYEEDADLEVDVAFITIANFEANPMFVTAGQIYVPFGAYETNMVSDPLTLDLGETRETALQGGFVSGDFNGSVYIFNGDNDKDGKNQISSGGINLGFSRELGDGEIVAGAGYLSDLGDSDTLQDAINDNQGDNDTDFVPAWTVNAIGRFGPFSLIGEYLAATKPFEETALPWQDGGAKPAAWNLEVGYDFDWFRGSTVAIGYQGTRQALALELPKQRFLATLSMEIYDSTALSLEWAYDEDYDINEGGTGNDANTFVAQLAVEF
ncbi:MAG: LbtU family siderophore porin [Candidatus Competibacteraceae bacterium]|jgi:hypothetical protein|nr:LbtU family siderophore porin [Candidatus Competibacteraceae bacterium]